MKPTLLPAGLIVLTTIGFSRNQDSTYVGEVMDKQCAQMAAHDNMMNSEGARDAQDCTLKCVKSGGSFAFLDSETKKVYLLEDTRQIRGHAGGRVQITGTYDADTDVLHVKSIVPMK